jgi:hypothetical protein
MDVKRYENEFSFNVCPVHWSAAMLEWQELRIYDYSSHILYVPKSD